MLARVTEGPYPPGEQVSVYVLRRTEPTPLDTDMHQAFEVGVVLSGRQERSLGESVEDMTAGDVFLYSAWEPHGWRVTSPPTRELIVHFTPEYLGEETLEGTSWLSLFASAPGERPRIRSQDARWRALAVADEISGEVVERRSAWRDGVRWGVLRLLLTLYREWNTRGKGGGAHARTSDLARLLPAIKLVGENSARRVSLREAAEACSLSVTQFRFVFCHTMGLSFGRFALRHRLAQAAHLLLTTELSVEEVARETGFADRSHLHHSFRRYYGMTPGRYQQEGRCLREPHVDASSVDEDRDAGGGRDQPRSG